MYDNSLLNPQPAQYPEIKKDKKHSPKTLNDILDNVIYRAREFCNSQELAELDEIMAKVMSKYELVKINEDYSPIDYREENFELMDKFLQAKSLDGCSNGTIKAYRGTIDKFLEWVGKSLKEITTDDIRAYLKYKMTIGKISNSYADTILRYMRTTFKWLCDEGYCYINPTTPIPKIKSPKKIREPLSPMEIEKLREYFRTKPIRRIDKARDIALFELLLSSGIRIGECVNLNRKDINWRERSFVVFGKGGKERKCYFNVLTKKLLQEYLNMRDDNKVPLFTTAKKVKGDRRLTVNAIERRMREAGNELDIKIYPHKLRRTMATNLLRKGVPLEQVRELLGHENIETTTIYALVDDNQVQFNHRRLMD